MVPGGAITCMGRSVPPLAGRVGSIATRRANPTALTVTASTALTLPERCGSVPVKSKVTSSPTSVIVNTMVPATCWSGAGPKLSMTSVNAQVPSPTSASAWRIRRSP